MRDKSVWCSLQREFFTVDSRQIRQPFEYDAIFVSVFS